jgi:NAD(P)-dependent dehydrogenase (short-subunit alcohol dehydrogenase family)
MQIGGSVFFVTGGASGLGSATARMLAGAGGKVVVADLKEAEGNALVKEIGTSAKFVRADVTDEASTKTAVDAALATFGAVHGLVNCAGVVYGEKTLGKEGPHKLASFARVININLVGTFNVVRLAADAMARNTPNAEGERGVIVNTASVAAFDGQMGQAAYAASKAAVAGMTLPLARDLSRNGIRVMAIAPGIFETPMAEQIPLDIAEALAKSVPFPPRLGRPAEFASLVRAIVENAMLNGEVIRLDGAIRMAAK